jgi:hypothetical protein
MAKPEVVERDRPKQSHQSLLKPSGSRIKSDSVLYSRLIPVVLGVLALLTIALIAVAAGVLLGIVPFR